MRRTTSALNATMAVGAEHSALFDFDPDLSSRFASPHHVCNIVRLVIPLVMELKRPRTLLVPTYLATKLKLVLLYFTYQSFEPLLISSSLASAVNRVSRPLSSTPFPFISTLLFSIFRWHMGSIGFEPMASSTSRKRSPN